MNILLISSYLPYPLFSGGHIRLFNLIKAISKRHAVTLICEKRDSQTDGDVKQVKMFCKKVITVPRRKQWSKANILKTGFSLYPFLMVGHTSTRMKQVIDDELRKNTYDLLHVETFYVMQNLPDTSLPIVLSEQNIEYMVYKRFADQASVFFAPFLYIDVLKMKYWEEKFWRKAAWVIAMSDDDKRRINKNTSTVVPNGVDINHFAFQANRTKIKKSQKTILFIGNFRWIENRDAAFWLLKKIWPEIKKKNNTLKLKLWVVGKDIPESIKKLGDESVFFDEHASNDTRSIYEESDMLLAPIRVGGGGKFKILEAMATGTPVVTTTIGIEGIEAKNNTELVIADEEYELANLALELLKNSKLCETLSKNARKLIEEKYDWGKIAKKLESVYQSVAG